MAAMAFHLRVRFHFPVARASTRQVANGSGARLYLASIPPRKYLFNYSARCCVSHLCIRRKELCGRREAKLLVPSGCVDRRSVQPRDTSCAAKIVMPAAILLGD